MDSLDAELIEALNSHDPHLLEKAYRKDPAGFRQWLCNTIALEPENVILKTWYARLFFNDSDQDESPEKALAGPKKNLLLYTVLISTVAWALAKIPAFITVSEDWFYPRFIPFLVIGSLVIYFNINRAFNFRLALQSGGGGVLLLLLLFFMPEMRSSDSIQMALIHLPFVLISLLGFVFGGGLWRNIASRLNFIRYGGELVIYTALVLLGGGVLTALTLGLFELIDISIVEWYTNYVLVWGLMSAPLIATWLWDQVLQQESKIASVIANVFSPLFLLMTVGYLFALLGEQRSPFNDRDFLIIFNALLLVVWGITVFSVTGRNTEKLAGRGETGSRLMDITNLSLVLVTLVIDGIALAAIIYRVIEFGITPNRVAVSGANLLIFIHLVWIFYEYAKELRGSSSVDIIKQTIARFLPVYTGWSVFVVVLLPLLFRFQ